MVGGFAMLKAFTLALPFAPLVDAALSGNFSVLTYNVAGLPEILSSSTPDENTPLISARLGPFNVINVQEDFNSHAALYASDNHTFRTATSGGAGIGSGLNTLSDFQFIDIDRVTWNTCDIDSGDCLTPKGFTFLRVKAADGVWFDLYNLHTDAGDEDGDRAARMSDLAQVRDYIAANSQGMAIIVMGDTNSRYTSEVDSDSLHDLINSAGLTDSWVRNTRGGVFPVEGADPLVCPFPFPSGTTQATMVACETVDKLLVRGSSAFTLVPTSFRNENDAFLNNTGYPLSDHYPLSSIISWSLSSSLRLSDPIGGPHGDHFSDINLVNGTTIPKISTLTIRTGSRMDAVSYTLSSGTSGSHGGTGGNPQTLTLASGEFITQIFGCQAQENGDTRVFFIQFTTNTGRTLSGGTTTDTCFTLSVPTDAGAGGKKWGLVAFYGRSGDEMDQLAAIWGAAY